MAVLDPRPRSRPEPPALRELFRRELGWRTAGEGDEEIEVDGRRYRLVPLGSRAPLGAWLCEPIGGGELPGYEVRRRIRARIGRRFRHHLTVFTDAAHSEQLWSWEGREPGGPLASREVRGDPGVPDAERGRWLRAIAREIGGANPALAAPRGGRGARDAGGAVLSALLRGVRRLRPDAFCPGGPLARLLPVGRRPPGAAALRQGVQDAIEASDDPELLRAFWRALRGLSVLDPACGTGAWLLSAMGALEPPYEACLERMGAWLGEAARARPPRRRNRLADFRAVIDRADDRRCFASRRHFAREAILLRTLFGADRDGDAVAAAELALGLRLHPSPDGPGGAPLPARIACHLREGDLAAGFVAFGELARAVPAGDILRLEEEAGTLARAEERMSELRLALGASAAELRAGWEDARRRRLALSATLDAHLARRRGIGDAEAGKAAAWLARRRPLHRCAEFAGVLARGGFSLERGRGR